MWALSIHLQCEAYIRKTKYPRNQITRIPHMHEHPTKTKTKFSCNLTNTKP